VHSRTGRTANVLADYRPRAPIVAVTRDPHVAQRLALQWGILPIIGDLEIAHDHAMERADEAARRAVNAKSGDNIAVLLGSVAGDGERSVTMRTIG
jgi:pyruvate kinase